MVCNVMVCMLFVGGTFVLGGMCSAGNDGATTSDNDIDLSHIMLADC